jgi:hypothetical protein
VIDGAAGDHVTVGAIARPRRNTGAQRERFACPDGAPLSTNRPAPQGFRSDAGRIVT